MKNLNSKNDKNLTKKRATSIKNKVKTVTKGHTATNQTNALKLPEINNLNHNIANNNPYYSKKTHKQFESQSPNPSRTKLNNSEFDYSNYYNNYKKKDEIDYNSRGANDLIAHKIHPNSSYKNSSHNLTANHTHDPLNG